MNDVVIEKVEHRTVETRMSVHGELARQIRKLAELYAEKLSENREDGGKTEIARVYKIVISAEIKDCNKYAGCVGGHLPIEIQVIE